MKNGGVMRFSISFFIFCAIILAAACSGEEGMLTWESLSGGSNEDKGDDLLVLPDGGALVAGYSKSFGSGKKQNGYLARFDGSGRRAWHLARGGDGDQSGNGVAGTAGGGFLMAGFDLDHDPAAWLVFVSSNGQFLSERRYGIGTNDKFEAIEAHPAGGFIAVGTSWTATNGSDAWVVRLAENGDVAWEHRYGGSGEEKLSDLAIAADGTIHAAGFTTSIGAGDKDMLVLVLDADGNRLFADAYGGMAEDSANGIALLPSGDAVLAGYTMSFGAGKKDLHVLRIAPDRSIRWVKSYGGSRDEAAQAVVVTADGNPLVCGTTESEGAGNKDLWLLSLDAASGEKRWARTHGGTGDEKGDSLALGPDGAIYITGYTTSLGTPQKALWLLRLDREGRR
jgi:uncharacterized delta-60 repeat protein